MNTQHKILSIEKNSYALELGFESGDIIVSINGKEVKDIFDYHFLIDDIEENVIEVQKNDGSLKNIVFSGITSDELGLKFDNGLMDDYKNCHNKCIFCFIDQMPPGMRETLYFKDDDARLSFLNGNYITMTNMSYEDIDRIIYYKLSPMNVSVHTTNPELRCKMLNNRFAGDVIDKIRRFYDAGIEMNGQIVLCKGINDGDELDRTIEDLSEFIPLFKSLSVVPVGLTKYREKLFPLESFRKEDAIKLIKQIEKWQKKFLEEKNTRFVFASDEWYLLAEKELPLVEEYEAYPQIENGVGMMRNLIDTFNSSFNSMRKLMFRKHEVSIATGKLAYKTIKSFAEKIEEKYPKCKVHVYEITNDFFGENITVSGLLTGGDLINQLNGKELGSKLLITSNMLRAGEEVFLDDITVSELEDTLQVPVDIVKSSGENLIKAIFNKKVSKDKGTGNYE